MRAEAERRGWDRFHLVGYSAGASAALACAAEEPDRLLSLALLEPAWAGGWEWSPAHRELWQRYHELLHLPPEQMMPAFMRLQVRPEVELSAPEGPDSALDGSTPTRDPRPAGRLRRVRPRPCCPGLVRCAGLLRPGRPEQPGPVAEVADRLGQVFADFTLEVFSERHHFDPPHRVEPTRLARSLRAIWTRSESSAD